MWKDKYKVWMIMIAGIICGLFAASVIVFFMGMAYEHYYEWFANHKWYDHMRCVDWYNFIMGLFA